MNTASAYDPTKSQIPIVFHALSISPNNNLKKIIAPISLSPSLSLFKYWSAAEAPFADTVFHMSEMNYDKMMSKKCCGIKGLRLNPRRFSVQRLRTNFLYIFRVFKRWKNSYRNCLRLLRRNLVRRRRTKAGSVQTSEAGYGFSTSSYSVVRTMNHSNSFCSEAIADCLEFIKRNSVSIDDDRKPMLNQD